MNTLEIIMSIIAGLGGLTGVCSIFMIKANRRAKDVETDGAVAEQWRTYAEKADERYEKLRKEKSELWERYNKIENKLVYYQTLHCECVNCPNRKPPLGKLLTEQLGIGERND